MKKIFILILILVYYNAFDIFAQSPSLAVLPLETAGISNNIGEKAYDLIINEMIAVDKYTLIERSKVDSVLNEIELSTNDIFEWDEETRIKIGRFKVARFILISRLIRTSSLFEEKYSLHLRIIEVETLKITHSATEEIDNIAEFENLVKKSVSSLVGIDIRLELNIFIGGSSVYYLGEIPESYTGWENNFKPLNDNQYFEEIDSAIKPDMGIDISGSIELEYISLGILIGYYSEIPIPRLVLIPFAGQKNIWWDPVWCNALSIIRVTPTIGPLINFKFNYDTRLKLQITGQGYNLYDIEYRGIDVYGDRNYEEINNMNLIEFGIIGRIQLQFIFLNHFYFGIHYEGFTSNFHSVGTIIGYSHIF